jgi:hypothetical protein
VLCHEPARFVDILIGEAVTSSFVAMSSTVTELGRAPRRRRGR